MSNEAFYYNKPVLITGGAGFIGSHIAEQLVQWRARVTVLDDLSTGSYKNIEHIRNNITFIHGSITEYEICKQATVGQKVIFHCAALVSVPLSIEQPYWCHRTNVEGTFLLLEAARFNTVERFIFSSSAAVYGETTQPCTEGMPCNPLSPYGYSKLIGEHYIQLYARQYGLKALSLRYFNVYGSRQNSLSPHASFYAQIMHKLHTNSPITIFGDGTQTRDFTAVEKIVEANLLLAQLPAEHLNGQPINVAQGKSKSLLEIITELRQGFPHYTQPLCFLPSRSGDIKHSQADCSKLNTLSQQKAP